MRYNEVLESDHLLNKQLQEYGKKVGEIYDPEEHRNKFKHFLEAFRHHDEFYTETDLKTGKITWTYGFRKWMRHPNPVANVSPASYMDQYVHPFVLDWYQYYVKAMTLVFAERESTTYLRTRFVLTVPMRNYQGKYLLVKMMSMPFGKTADGRIGSFINTYTVCTFYQGEAFSLEVFEGNKKIDEKKDDLLEKFKRKLVGCMFLNKKHLTQGDFKYARIISHLSANNKKPNLDSVLAYQRKHENKDIKADTVERAIERMHHRVKVLLGFDMLEALKKGLEDPFLPGYEDPFRLIQYCIDSGIVDLIKASGRRKT